MPEHQIIIEPSPKRIRAIANGKTIADSLCAMLLLESDSFPVYYLPRDDVRMDLLERTNHRTTCPYKGDASYFSLKAGNRRLDNAAWSYEQPKEVAEKISGLIALDHDKMDHWFEEDEEVSGHPRDPHHRIDVRPSTRQVRVVFAGEEIANTRRALFLFETGLPTRYCIPPDDVRQEFLSPTRTKTICPYKGEASYWSLHARGKEANDAVWAYPDPLPECPRIEGHFCFYPEKVERIEVEGESSS